MTIFNPAYFLRLISLPTLRQFTDAHPLGPELAIDWEQPEDSLPRLLTEALTVKQESLSDAELSSKDREDLEHKLHLWQDDLRRAHMMSNELAINEFLAASLPEQNFVSEFADRDTREKALWVLTYHPQIFRDVELHLAFQAKADGKYWKKHRIQASLEIPQERDKLEKFSNEVAKLYEKVGGGKSTHVELSHHASDKSIQLTIYVEGPVTALAHFSENSFKKMTTRIALETALVYQPATGVIESVVKGGAKNHAAVLELFGKHLVGQEIKPEEIEKKRYKLNELRDGMLEPFEDWSSHGIEKIRLRRARFSPKSTTGVAFQIEASPDKDQDDAIKLGLDTLKIHHSFETEYNLDGGSVVVIMKAEQGQKSKSFSFSLYSTGSSTIKNLSSTNQTIALTVLRALNVIDGDEGQA